MPKVVWTPEAEEQLLQIPSPRTINDLLALSGGIQHLPDRGRRVPELKGRPEYVLVRELILPGRARLFYLHVTDSDEVIILGFLYKGQSFRLSALGPYFNP